MNCIILGDKYQKGMKSKGCAGLIKINKQTNILQNQLNVLTSVFGNVPITYIYGFDNKKFIDFIDKSDINISLVFNEQYNKYNHIYSLSLVKDLFNQDTIIVDGYKILHKKIFKKFVTPDSSRIFINNEGNYDNVGCVLNNDGSIENFNFDLSNSLESIYYLDAHCAKAMLPYLSDARNYNHFIFEILNKLIDHGHSLQSFGSQS